MEADPFEAERASGWEVVHPLGGTPLDGVDVAGFRDRYAVGLDARVLPQPTVTVVIDLGDHPIALEDPGGTRTLSGLVAGMSPRPARVRGRHVDCVEVHLSPLTAYASLGVSPTDREDGVIDLADLWGRHEALLREELAAAEGWEARFALLDRFLAERCGAGASVDPEVAAAWERIASLGGLVGVNTLAEACGWSRKRLWSRFTSQVGLTPKRAAMLVRFDRAARALAAGLRAAEAAAVCGYADQSHLHRDVLAFAGCAPGALGPARVRWSAREE
ncbi:helix-turn-helix domain-containing protein [Streptomyces sp. NPDC041068]|uniref:helix-turn-helix domain-containing protein n=1 Tax=Streptomyces sp. NPDC041068 TaxID=3155130 RepID=UPI0033C29F8F